jgi:hypothetical protein
MRSYEHLFYTNTCSPVKVEKETRGRIEPMSFCR